MNKRQIIASLNKIANELDGNGLFSEANEVTEVMMKLSQTGISSTYGMTPPDSGMFGPQDSGFINPNDPLTKNVESPLKTTRQNSAVAAQKWINKNSTGDVMALANKAMDAYKLTIPGSAQRSLLNDVIYILSNNPKYKSKSYENKSDPLATFNK